MAEDRFVERSSFNVPFKSRPIGNQNRSANNPKFDLDAILKLAFERAPGGPTPSPSPSLGGRRFFQNSLSMGSGSPAAMNQSASGMTDAQRRAMIQDKRTSYGGAPAPQATPSLMGSGMGANPISALFAPMFQDLKRQRQLANQRYEANSQQVTNIYGQITGARSQDTAALETAFKRLVDAASTRSTAVNTGIDASEAARLQQNQAALQSMGLGELSTSQGDIASQTAAQAKQTNTLNSANFENMLRVMGATAGQQVQSDIASYNYAMLEDLGQLRGAREEFAQELGQQRGELKSKRAQATFEYQQAQQRAAASARAAEQKAAMQMATEAERQMAEMLKASGPAMVIVDAYVKSEQMSPAEGAAALNAITEFYQFNKAPMGKWFAGEAKGVLFEAAGETLSQAQKRAISAIFDQTLPKG